MSDVTTIRIDLAKNGFFDDLEIARL